MLIFHTTKNIRSCKQKSRKKHFIIRYDSLKAASLLNSEKEIFYFKSYFKLSLSIKQMLLESFHNYLCSFQQNTPVKVNTYHCKYKSLQYFILADILEREGKNHQEKGASSKHRHHDFINFVKVGERARDKIFGNGNGPQRETCFSRGGPEKITPRYRSFVYCSQEDDTPGSYNREYWNMSSLQKNMAACIYHFNYIYCDEALDFGHLNVSS